MYEVNKNYDKNFQPGNLYLLFQFLKEGLFWFILGLVCATGGALLDVAAGYVKDIREGQTEINTIAQKTTGNMDIIKIFRLNNYFNRKFKTAVNKEISGYLKKNFIQICLFPLSFFAILMPFFITIVWGAC
jgi:ABC-type multidrug transport system fused ATPase/permease subunit